MLLFGPLASSRPGSKSSMEFLLFLLYFSFYLFELVFDLHQPVLAQLDQLPRFADLDERLLEIDLLLLLKPVRDPLDVLQIFF